MPPLYKLIGYHYLMICYRYGIFSKINGTLTNRHLTIPSPPMLTLPLMVASPPVVVVDVPEKYKFENLDLPHGCG